MLQFILLNICVPFISTLLAFAFNTWSKIYFEKRQYNQKLLEDRYYKGYLPFFINFTTNSITNLFLLRQSLTSEDKVEIINKFTCIPARNEYNLLLICKIALYIPILIYVIHRS